MWLFPSDRRTLAGPRRHLAEDVVVFDGVGVLGGARLVGAADLHELFTEFARPGGAVADKYHFFTRLGRDRPVVGAEHHVHTRQLRVALLVVEPQYLDGLLKRPRAAAPAVVGALGLGRRADVGGDAAALEVFFRPLEADLEAAGALLGVGQADVAKDGNLRQIGGAKAALDGKADVFDGERVDADDRAAHRVERHLAVTHNYQMERERLGGEHAPLPRGDRIDGNELRLDDVLQVGDLFVEAVIVVDE